MSKLLELLNRYKGYLASALAAAVLMLNPASVTAFITVHPRYSAVGLLVWSSLLHWAQGRQVKVAP